MTIFDIMKKGLAIKLFIIQYTRFLFHFVDDMQALGMESGAISDSKITASSEWSVRHSPKRARLHTRATADGLGAWSCLTSDLKQWLQVDLGKITPVTHVATQGRNSFSPAQMVTKYKLQFSDDGTSFLFYKRQGQSSDAVNKNIITRYSFKTSVTVFLLYGPTLN